MHENVNFEMKSLSVMMLWLSRYFRYSIQAIRVESTGTGGDRSISSSFTLVVNKVFLVKEEKEKKRKQEVMEGEGDENSECKKQYWWF